MTRFRLLVPLVVLVVAGLLPLPAAAGQVETKVAFDTADRWIDLDVSDGPVVLHRIRLVRQGVGPKSRLTRPGNTDFVEDVQIQLEFSNASTRDWKVRMRVDWRDADGRLVDGYDDDEELDSESRYDQKTVTLSTLRYGLEQARTLHVRLAFDPD